METLIPEYILTIPRNLAILSQSEWFHFVKFGARPVIFNQLNKKADWVLLSISDILNIAFFPDIRIIYLSWLHIRVCVDKKKLENIFCLLSFSYWRPKDNSGKYQLLILQLTFPNQIVCHKENWSLTHSSHVQGRWKYADWNLWK